MSLRTMRRRLRKRRESTIKRFAKHKRINRLSPPGQHDMIVVLDHLKPNYNVGKIFRSADAFGVREVHLVGIDFFDPSPAMGSFKWVPARFHSEFSACHRDLSGRGYTLFALEPGTGGGLSETALPEKSAFVFGHEEYGLSFDRADFPDIAPLCIPQFGRVESLNVSIAASVVMYEYLRQHNPRFARRTP
jgi:tRNA G18 (ribose-2'-O)-methylase SpoU